MRFMEVNPSVYSVVCTFFRFASGSTSAKSQSPVLKLMFVFVCELLGSCQVGRFADNLVGFSYLRAEGIIEPILDEADGEVGDVDADPAAVEFLGDLDGGAAAAEGVEDYVAFV